MKSNKNVDFAIKVDNVSKRFKIYYDKLVIEKSQQEK